MLKRFSADKNNPSIKGNLTGEEIVRIDWERNYKKKDVSFNQAKLAVKAHVDNGYPIFRVRNTFILITPENGMEEVKFHTITADTFEVYSSLMLMFFISLNRDQGTQLAYTYLDDKKMFRAIKRLVNDYATLEPNDEDPSKGKYILTIELGPFVLAMQQKAAERRQ